MHGIHPCISFGSKKARTSRARRNCAAVHPKSICIYDNTKPKQNPRYLFNNPADYWNKFYFSWLNWPEVRDQVVYVKVLICCDGRHL